MGAEASGVLPIYTWGKLEALETLAAKGVQVGAALQTRAADEAEFQTTQAYWGLQMARGGRKSLVEALGRLDDATKTLTRLREQKSEQVTQMDVYKLEFLRREVEARAGAAESGEAFALKALQTLTGATGEFVVIDEELPEPGGQPQPVEIYQAMAQRNRPEMRAIDAGLAAREREVFIRERLYLPDLGLAGFFRWKWTTSATRQLSPFAYDPYNDLSAGVALVVHQTWDFPSKSAQLDQSRGELEKLEYQRDLLVAGVNLEVQQAHGQLAESLLRAQKHTQAERAARRWATSAFAAFDVGTTDTRDVFESFLAWAASSGEKIQDWHDVQVSLGGLSKAAGARIELVH
ncbi:MAG: TolC family protein [Myxococcaceae bacterium]